MNNKEKNISPSLNNEGEKIKYYQYTLFDNYINIKNNNDDYRTNQIKMFEEVMASIKRKKLTKKMHNKKRNEREDGYWPNKYYTAKGFYSNYLLLYIDNKHKYKLKSYGLDRKKLNYIRNTYLKNKDNRKELYYYLQSNNVNYILFDGLEIIYKYENDINMYNTYLYRTMLYNIVNRVIITYVDEVYSC